MVWYMNGRPFLLILPLIGLLFQSCSESPCLKSTGEESTQWRTVPEYHRLSLSDGFDYVLLNDSSTEIKLEGGENLLSFVSLEVKQGQLEVKDDNTCRFLRNNRKRIKVYIPARKVNFLFYNGYGQLSTADTLPMDQLSIDIKETGDLRLSLHARRLTILHRGFGDVYLAGKAENLNMTYENFCRTEAQEMVCDTLYVNTNSFADGFFFSEQSADILLRSKGNLYLRGPAMNLRLRQEGQGQLIRQ